MNRPIRLLGIAMLAGHLQAEYEVPQDAVPLGTPAPNAAPEATPATIHAPAPATPQQPRHQVPPPPLRDTENPTPRRDERSRALRASALSSVLWSPGWYTVCGGQAVYTPRPRRMSDFRAAAGSSCPAPRFSAPGVRALGWSASGAPPSGFEDCGDGLSSLSFFIVPESSGRREMEGVSADQYASWNESVDQESAANMARLVSSAVSRALSVHAMSPSELRSGTSGGMPVLVGKLEGVDGRFAGKTARFAAVVTAIGSGENPPWALCVVADLDRSSEGNPPPQEDAVVLARAFYYLNRDFNAPSRRVPHSLGPYAPRALR